MLNRRTLLNQACALTGLAYGPSPTPEEPQKVKVIVTGGHPGDPEYGCGGTIARYSDLGHEVVLLYLNEGVPAGKPKDGVRVAEARRACEILKARAIFAGQIDGEAVVDQAHADAFREILVNEQPGVVFTHWPIDNHADHRAVTMLVLDAWRKMGRSFAIYFYEVSDGEDTVLFLPHHYQDISDQEPRKRQACFAHASQSPDKYYAMQDAVAKFRGMEKGCRHAEAFIRHVQGPEFPLPGTLKSEPRE